MNEVCNNSKDTLSPKSEGDMIINLKEELLACQLRLTNTSHSQYYNPRKNKYLLQHRMNKSWPLCTNMYTRRHMKNLTSDRDANFMHQSMRILSRSAKMMRALSSSSVRCDIVGIRKSLNFDSTPSSKRSSSCDENSISSIGTDTPSPVLSSSLADSTYSNIPITSAESIDENQNRTPQQNRKHIKTSSGRNDITENMHIRSRASYIMSLVEQKQNERTDKNVNQGISSHSCSFNPFSRPLGRRRVITASTPRNLSQEFDQEIDYRPHTPENVINITPESISAIKKSHKKEKLYYQEQLSAQKTDVSTIESASSEADMTAESNYNTTSENESQKKQRNIKRTLTYNDEHCDIKSDSHHSVQQKTTPIENDSFESDKLKDMTTESNYNVTSENESRKKQRNIKRTLTYNDEHCDIKSDSHHSVQQKTMPMENLNSFESDKLEDIDFNKWKSREENLSDGIRLIDYNNEEDCSRENIRNRNEEIRQLLLQKELLDNVNNTSENSISPQSNPSTSQDANKVVTPENHIDMLKHVWSESIKKSHKKMKHGSRKTLFNTNDLQRMELLKSELSMEDICNIDQDITGQSADHVSSSQNSEFNRPSTPENVNSSRLLLFDFSSVKKSHKKDKCSKRTSSFIECCGYEYLQSSNNLLRRYEEENIGRTLRGNESLELKESPEMSSKKKKLVSMPLQSSTPKVTSVLMSSEHKNINDEFKIARKKATLRACPSFLTQDKMSQEEDKSEQTTLKEIDCFRCVTPIVHRFEELRNNEDIASERDKRSETDVNVMTAADTATLTDKNGRSTPINMSTTELLCNLDSIKKSHKKDKHSHSKEPILKKKRSRKESEYVSFTNNEKILGEPILFLKHRVDDRCAEKDMYSIMREEEKDKSYEETVYDDPQPSTSREDNIENTKNLTKSILNTTPPNSLRAINSMKLFHTTSIKKSHKKKRDINAQTKYILMSKEYDELSDDGSIFDEEDRLNFIENDNNAEIMTT